MTTYLTIITTVLVMTQIIRISQNHINLKNQKKNIQNQVEWILQNEVTEDDFKTQREAFRLIVERLREKSVEEFIEGEY